MLLKPMASAASLMPNILTPVLMINKENFLNKAIQRIRLDEIAVKETYFEDDLHAEDKLREFEQKYHNFRDNFIEYKPNKV